MEHYKRNPNTKCIVCSKVIYRKPSQIKRNKGQVFCSMVCYGLFQRREKPCVVCGKMIMSKFNKKTCSRSCANIHRAGIVYKIGSPRSKVKSQQAIKIRLLEKRGRKCGRCNYKKYEILQVHHKDRNKNNNELDNLELICPNCHYEEHFLKNSWLRKKIEKDIKKDILD